MVAAMIPKEKICASVMRVSEAWAQSGRVQKRVPAQVRSVCLSNRQVHRPPAAAGILLRQTT
jgi:hypothetical protein